MSKVLCFVGSSGTGKSTLLNYLNEKHALPTMELGARKFLDSWNTLRYPDE